MSYISVNQLVVGYEKKAIAKPISFHVEKGDYLCIVGENGAGKTTLLKTLLGLLAPVQGEIRFGDGLKKTEIGYLPQQTFVQKDFPASVREIVLSGCQGRLGLRPFYNRSEKKLAEEQMKALGIQQLANRCYRDLSGGQQQRVLLARALCATQKLLVLDEPVAGLDPKVTEEMYEQLKELNQKGITILMISHDLHTAISYASHVLHVGKEVFFGTKESYLKKQEEVLKQEEKSLWEQRKGVAVS